MRRVKKRNNEGMKKKVYKRKRDRLARRPSSVGAARKKPRSLSAPEAEGILIGSRRGFGFVRLGEGEPDVFIPPRGMRGARDGDAVRIALHRTGERPEGEVVGILTRASETVIGEVVRDSALGLSPHGDVYLLPDSPRLPAYPLSLRERTHLGEKVEIGFGDRGYARILRSFGKATSRTANYRAILAECAIPTEFSPDALHEAEKMAAEPLSEEGRRRHRGAVLTIDSERAKDLDDAISVKRTKDGYVFFVHIADVSHYVRPFTSLDAAAHERGNSVYFADRVVPMLPEALSNGACSLGEGEDKYTLTAEITLGEDGSIQKTLLYKSIIRSAVRGVYSEVNSLFSEGEASPFYPKYKRVYAALSEMRALYRILAEKNRARGVLELESPEPIITLDEDGEPTDIVRAERGEAERLIEAFMLTANRAVAEELSRRSIPCVFRIHEPPPPEKYVALTEYLVSLSLTPPWKRGEAPTALALSHLLAVAEEKGLSLPVSLNVLRSMAKARYEAASSPHFGLALTHYCHFTSPIRRLSDLVTHRIIKAVLIDGAAPSKYRAMAKRAADAATNGEIRALMAERRIEALYKTLYMQKHIGERYSGIITSVTPHGFYVELQNTCEGLVPLSLLDGDYTYDERRRTLFCAATVFAVGDQVEIEVKGVEISVGKITFSLA